MAASLLRLPNELLLGIINRLEVLPRHRRRDLIALTTVCKRLNSIVTELLHGELCVRICGLAQVLEVYTFKPELAPKVKSLELFYEKRHDSDQQAEQWLKGLHISKAVMPSYTITIQACSISQSAKTSLLDDLSQGDFSSVFALAITMLPNIHTLLLGTLADDIHLLSDLFVAHPLVPEVPSSTPYLPIRPKSYLYLKETLTLPAPRLTTIELPFTHSSKTNLSAYTNLTDLNIALRTFVTYEYSSEDAGVPDWKHAVLPPTLRKLTIGHPRVGQLIRLNILKNLLHSKASGVLDALQVVEIYIDGRNPADDNSLFYTEPTRAEKQVQYNTLASFTKLLRGLGVQTVFHWSDSMSVFRPLTSKVSGSYYSDNELRAMEVRGCFEYMRTDAEVIGRIWWEEEAEAREERHKERRARGDDSDTSEDDISYSIGFD